MEPLTLEDETVSENYSPQLSWREANLVKDQLWKNVDDEIEGGPIVAKRLWSFGTIQNIQQLMDVPVGGVIKTRVSVYTRVA